MRLDMRGRQHAQNVVEYGTLMATIVLVGLMGTFALGQPIEQWFEVLAGHVTTHT